MYILDSNIFIYFLKGDQRLIEFLEDLDAERFYTSVISRLEVLIGHDKDHMSLKEVEFYLDDCENIAVDKSVIQEAFHLTSKLKKKLKFKDLLIAATAKVHKKVLVTGDKDFKNVPGLKVLIYKSLTFSKKQL